MTIPYRETFSSLTVSKSDDLKLCPKLTFEHIDLKGLIRMRVRPPVQLLSTTAEEISYLFPRKLQEAREVKLID